MFNDKMLVELSADQIVTLCRYIQEPFTSQTFDVSDTDDFLASVSDWREERFNFVEKYLSGSPEETRESANAIRDELDEDCDLLELLASRLPKVGT